MTPADRWEPVSPLYGRGRELARCARELERLRVGRGRSLVLTSDPGLGRTALLRHLAATFRGGTARLAPAVPPHGPRDELLGLLYGGTAAEPLRTALLRAAREQPLLVCVDDLHLWPADPRRALCGLARSLTAAPAPLALFLSVAAHRAAAVPDELPVLRLDPLDDAAAHAYLTRLTAGRRLPSATSARLVHEAAGSPLVLQELVEGLRGRDGEDGADREGDGGSPDTGDTGDATDAVDVADIGRAGSPPATRPARALRLVVAAERARLAGRPEQAARLLGPVRRLSLPDEVTGQAQLVHGLLESGEGPVADARASLLLAARLLTPHDPRQALRARLAAAEASWAMGDAAAYREALVPLAGPTGVPGGEGAFATQLRTYLRGMDAVLSGDPHAFAAGRGTLRSVVEAAESADAAEAATDEAELLVCAGAAALVVGDLTAACRLGSRALAVARARGRFTVVPKALEQLAYGELRAGRHARARAHAEEGVRASRRTGRRNDLAHHHAILALVASLDQDARTVAQYAAAAEETAVRHGLLQAETLAQWARARADLARGRPQEAAARLHPLLAQGRARGHFAVRMLAVPCFVEASVLAGRSDEARAAVGEFALWAGFGHDPQAPAQLLRCRALLAADEDPDRAAALYPEALARHDAADGDFERARTALLYGKWLRRARKPAKARDALRDALIAFERCGAGAWAAQAAAELRATGEAAAPQLPDTLDGLTPQQVRIARLVAEGATNREVARHLSVSPRTVDHHLRNVFAALGVRSRVELARAVTRADGARTDA
ncbi:LuxR family transcriptional regulator [Streptomyces indicus]|uniref:Regulatory protein, luxR family n=1 Tax=Streptomyces indicus TaxID=417292 RepID=A0A1G8Z377_9ACTN|nr:LuxR family transcriptional regulator [Streptomyces indicus]SDK08700.1 regulatory protein, luxR family [Streptomyces indicus]